MQLTVHTVISGQAGVHALLSVVVVLKPGQGHVTILLPHTVVVHVLQKLQNLKSVTQTHAHVIIHIILFNFARIVHL